MKCAKAWLFNLVNGLGGDLSLVSSEDLL